MRRRFLYLLIFILLFSLLPTNQANASTFNDVKLYKDEIEFLIDKGILTGYPDGSFKPYEPVTRLQAITMILNEKGITDFTAPDPKMTDMKPGSNGYKEVAKAVELGFISGKVKKDGTKYFDPQAPLSRSQLAKILVLGYTLPESEYYTFYDVPRYHQASRYISTLAAERITIGYTDGTFRPESTVTRRDFAVFMARMLKGTFKPDAQVRNVSYAMDPTKVYTYKDSSGLSTIEFTGLFYNEYEVWRLTDAKGSFLHLRKEEQHGVRIGYIASEWSYVLKYPIAVGHTWSWFEIDDEGYDFDKSTITSINETVVTPAGTFYDVVVVDNAPGNKGYYARGIGLIKSVSEMFGVYELVGLE